MSDVVHVFEDYKHDVDSQWREQAIKELREAKEARARTERRVKELEEEAEKMKKCIQDLEDKNKECDDLKKQISGFSVEMTKAKTEVLAESLRCTGLVEKNTVLEGEKLTMTKEIADLKVELDESVKEMTSAVNSGYQECYDRLAAAGVDLTDRKSVV